MKTNQKFNSTLSIKSIEAKARKAAAMQEARRLEQQSTKNAKKPRKKPRMNPVSDRDREINSIFQLMNFYASDSETLVLERGGKSGSLIAEISVFDKADLLCQGQKEEVCSQTIDAGENLSKLTKISQAIPKVVYAFYADTYDSNKIGSVAIYCNNAHSTKNRVLLRGNLFGHRIRRATVEIGRRPFVDVVFAV